MINHSDMNFLGRIQAAFSHAKLRITVGSPEGADQDQSDLLSQSYQCILVEVLNLEDAAAHLSRIKSLDNVRRIAIVAVIPDIDPRMIVSLTKMGFTETISIHSSSSEILDVIFQCLNGTGTLPVDATHSRANLSFVGPTISRFEEYEAEIFAHALKQSGGCVSRAATALGVGRATIYRKMRSYGLQTYTKASGSGPQANSQPGSLN